MTHADTAKASSYRPSQMSAQARKRLVALHGWAATVIAAVLYVVLLTGCIAVFDHEILNWSRSMSQSHDPLAGRIAPVVERISRQVPTELHQEVNIFGGDDGALGLRFSGPVAGKDGRVRTQARLYMVEPKTGRILSAQAGLSDDIGFGHSASHALEHFLVDLHVRLHVPGRLGLYLTGITGIAMLVAVISGVLIHRHILSEMFVTERPGKRLVSYRDKHNLVAVWSLPFAFLLAFTGAFLSFATSLGLPIVALSAFGGDINQAMAAVFGAPAAPSGVPAAMADLDLILKQAGEIAARPARALEILQAGQEGALVRSFHEARAGDLLGRSLVFDGTSGAYLRDAQLLGAVPSVGNTVTELVAPLHFGKFAGYGSRLVWAALGAAMTYTVVTGMQLWFRRRTGDRFWQQAERAFEVLVWGLPLALCCAAVGYFLTRLTGDPEAGTVNGFLLGSGLSVGLAWHWRSHSVAGLMRRMRGLLGIGLLVLPVLRLQSGGLSWGEGLAFGDADVLLIEVFCLLGGAVCLALSKRRAVTGADTLAPVS